MGQNAKERDLEKILAFSSPEDAREFLNASLNDDPDPYSQSSRELALSFQNFDPEEAMRLLVKIASARKMSREEFFQEMQDFIFFGFHEHSNSLDADRCDSEYARLEDRYKVIFGDPDANSFYLMCSLFPHFVVRQTLEKWTIARCEQRQSTSKKPQPIAGKFTIPRYFCFFAFGGLIPSEKGMELNEETRKMIIVIHQYGLTSLLKIGVALSHFLMQKHIECSQLSSEGRLSELIKLGVLTQSKIPSTLTTTIYESISDGFRKKVDVELRLHSTKKPRTQIKI
ncbi:unnamed protein product [Bemisia tabaci]|uniref:Uncharacterized protein n=1 Tax=Bemisia tabaci TaxID=7038 RepID=A0A9P0FAF8_BEMTA|nr:unnamed protein product [Bemisia tabaci]